MSPRPAVDFLVGIFWRGPNPGGDFGIFSGSEIAIFTVFTESEKFHAPSVGIFMELVRISWWGFPGEREQWWGFWEIPTSSGGDFTLSFKTTTTLLE